MKHFRVVLFSSMALDAIGLIIIFLFGSWHVQDTVTIDLPPGETSVGSFAIDTHGGGAVSGNFDSASGRPLIVMMLDEHQYEDYSFNRSHGTQFSEEASAGEFSIDDAAMELCYVVVTHSQAVDQAEQLTLNYEVSSMNWTNVVISMAFIFGGSIAGAAAMFKRQKERKAVLGPLSPYSDVVMFDEVPKK